MIIRLIFSEASATGYRSAISRIFDLLREAPVILRDYLKTQDSLTES